MRANGEEEAIGSRYRAVLESVRLAEAQAGRPQGCVRVSAVSKTFGAESVRVLLEAGHRIFAENRVQEAEGKYPALRRAFPDLELRLIGPLQTNKATRALELFDAIETVDRDSLAKALSKEARKRKAQEAKAGESEARKRERFPELFVQVNIGEEPQKSGIAPCEAVAFVGRCREVHGLEISGLTCIPPFGENPGPYFALTAKLAGECAVSELSMGMSADFETAISFGATRVRIGSALFGSRPSQAGAL